MAQAKKSPLDFHFGIQLSFFAHVCRHLCSLHIKPVPSSAQDRMGILFAVQGKINLQQRPACLYAVCLMLIFIDSNAVGQNVLPKNSYCVIHNFIITFFCFLVFVFCSISFLFPLFNFLYFFSLLYFLFYLQLCFLSFYHCSVSFLFPFSPFPFSFISYFLLSLCSFSFRFLFAQTNFSFSSLSNLSVLTLFPTSLSTPLPLTSPDFSPKPFLSVN